MSTQNSAGRATTPTGANNHLQATKPEAKRTAPAELPVVFATLFLATGTAVLDWLVVRTCPFCSHAHRHIRFERDAQVIERSPGCASRRTYLVRVADVVPAGRKRGAA